MVFDGCRGWGHAAQKFFHRESWNWIEQHSSLLMCHVSIILAPFARWNEGFSCASLLIYLILGTETCSGSPRHSCGLFCTWHCLLYILWSYLAGFTASTPFFLNPGCATVPQICLCLCGCLLYVYISCGIRSLCVVAGCAVGSVTILQNAYTLSPAILVCLYLGLGQAGINYILLGMVLICQCMRPLLWLQLVPKLLHHSHITLFLCPGWSPAWHSDIQRYLLKAALTYRFLQQPWLCVSLG